METIQNTVKCSHCGTALIVVCSHSGRFGGNSGSFMVDCPACHKVNAAVQLGGDAIVDVYVSRIRN